ncbi:hypothetical protein L1887_13949 [Cichorium endivia]|nr:hypothetical protein L1887_13949 [Cichorium endivia]
MPIGSEIKAAAIYSGVNCTCPAFIASSWPLHHSLSRTTTYNVNQKPKMIFQITIYTNFTNVSDYLQFELENSCEMMMNYVGHGSWTHMEKTLADVSGFGRFVNMGVPIHEFKPSSFLIPDEGSSVMNENGVMKSSGNLYRGKRKAKSSLTNENICGSKKKIGE